MLRLRRSEPEMTIELMPLIDVIFLILTFFVYAMVMPLESYASGKSPEPNPAVAVTLRLDGNVYVGQELTGLDGLLPAIEKAQANDSELVVYLVLEEGDSTTDRGPLLTATWDRLHRAGIDIQLVGAPSMAPPAPAVNEESP